MWRCRQSLSIKSTDVALAAAVADDGSLEEDKAAVAAVAEDTAAARVYRIIVTKYKHVKNLYKTTNKKKTNINHRL